MHITLKDYISNDTLKAQDVVNHYVDTAKKINAEYFSFVRFHDDYIKNNISEFSKRHLKAAPIGIKDIIFTQDYISSCGSKMMENYVSPYSATCIVNLEKNGGLMIGKTNMDEFAMGTSTESSYFGTTKNIYGTDRNPGGSSGGSAAAVASGACIAALGTDTGGSVRQPAACCGIVGMKPTYGMVSRYGVQAMAASLNQVGVLTQTVDDAEILLKAIAGFDPKDSQSDPRADDFVNSEFRIQNSELMKFKIGVPKEALGEGLDPQIKKLFLETVEKLRSSGIVVEDISLPMLEYSVPMYYTLMPAEISTDLARFDGIKFGLQSDSMKAETLQKYYESIRSEGFGDEVKRRILLGSFVLSSANYEGYYLKAQRAREELKAEFDATFANYDIILTPTVPEVAWKVGTRNDDPIKMYLADMYTIPANIAGLPAMSLPMGMVEDQGEMMPTGIQVMAQKRSEDKLFAFGKYLEKQLTTNN
ncbi:MAG: Asp-tRNA(Asn)/Glu-tRNA(Gln) amidotransferase subunit GatA [candidate division SR1 bacterium]|nr:Asp-tRNA(Asn)/Glu-tRNA(Gln) amidotransferase subunit GatA [candidate division SR1 bacterium]